jgi:hypothetical protein
MSLADNKASPDDSSGPIAGAAPDGRGVAPRVWLILSDKLGDNAQVRTIADALPWPCEERQIVVRNRYVLGKPRVRASLHHVDLARSDPLEPPWPDLIITVGRRMSMVALWVRSRSGGRTRIVLVGRPRTLLRRFDLIVTSAQYRLPARENVVHLTYPLMRVDEAAIAEAAREWRAEFDHLPRPLIALMVGGRIKSLRFDAEIGRRLAEDAANLAARENGTLVVVTSRRTPSEVADTLAAALPPGAILRRWTPGGQGNLYRALLGLADRFIVTEDSVSMLVEIARLGKPLAIYPLPPSRSLLARALRWLGLLSPRGGAPVRHRALRAVQDLLYDIRLLGYPRDLSAIHRRLIDDGCAVWFGEPFPPSGQNIPDELPQVVRRIVALVDSTDRRDALARQDGAGPQE